ncbi:bifunctional TolB-family protein/amidohydrolase [Pedobacter quisquiliarum]|uniref:Bifunctional TolB-family protein/amidohydrolase n=1 Tax=Pedobacter quisquiliarum TaxID=1834438 RepID=A0A916XGE8_9SPHI|nr:amidohydrolase family protein [Pedobacter quisquiliarum]GGC71624.1 bifunctional TolB-family protein/amidohydrolase [Pedobacter quisquiliarum]
MRKTLLSVLILAAAQPVFSQDKKDAPKWDVEKFRGTTKNFTINTDEGTWMNLDVSPDGKDIVFDILGDIYIMPISGGTAKLLTGGAAFDVQPRFSPNGKYISYTSDKSGGDNIWMMNRDGSGKRQITKENFRLLNNATWMPNSEYIVARKHFTGTRSLGAGEMWMYNINGGDGVQLTKRKNDQQDSGEPNISPNGKFLYYSEDVTPGPTFEYSKDPNGTIYAIKQLDLSTGKTTDLIRQQGGAARPQISPDGKLMAFVKRVRLKSVLYIQNLQTGEESPVFDDLSKDQQETWAIFGVYPNFAWTPDSRGLVFYAKGKIKKVDLASLSVAEIPFQVTTNQTVQQSLHFPQQVFTPDFNAKMIRQLTTSPDGKMVVFNTAGFLYKKELPNGTPERLTNGMDFEFEPSFSPDGKYVVYTTWSDEFKGSVKRADVRSGRFSTLTDEKGFYYSPSYSSKGDRIVFRKGRGNDVLGQTYGKGGGIYVMSANGGSKTLVTDNGIKPKFNADDSRIFFQSSENGKKAYKSVNVNGGGEVTHYTSGYATQFEPSPDGRWMAFTEFFNVYITPMMLTGSAQDLSSGNKSIPLTRLTKDAGSYIHWSNDSKRLFWTLGEQYYAQDVKNAFPFVDGAAQSSREVAPDSLSIGLKLKADAPSGIIALTGARIITMKGDEVIENGSVLIENNKIVSIGKAADVKVPEQAKVVDLNGKTIMPGMVDVHAHLRTSPDGISPQTDWSYLANLSFGVTTAHDPSSNTEMVFSQAEMLKAGRMIGPRLYSTGSILYGADADMKVVVNSLDDALSSLRRLKAVGAFSVKSYNQPRREQRQQILEAARQLKMEVVPEGGSTFYTNLNMVIDGHTGLEHSLPVSPVYKDVVSLWKNTQVGYTPTLIVAYGGQWGENYWYDRTNVWENERLLAFTPRSIIDERARRRTTSEYGDYNHIDVSKAAKQLADAGVKVNLGAHGQIQGLGAHWELWMLAQGGMSPLQAIRAATLNGANYLGMDKEIGSLEVGKLADLVIMDANPLEDIRNSEKIKYVMINGRLYDSMTMNELISREKIRGKMWFEMGSGSSYSLPTGTSETWTYTVPHCD